MVTVAANAIEIEYETMGQRGGRPLLLVSGLGGQLNSWDDEFCQRFVDQGFFVVRHDNRDSGRSSKFADAPQPDVRAILSGDLATAPYRVSDMAADAAALLDEIGLPSAHVLGVSMGGMIAQAMAIEHGMRVRSLCSVMSTTGDQSVGHPTDTARDVLFQPSPADREEAIEHSVESSRVFGSPGFPFDETRARRRATDAYDRSFCPEGTARQLAAILASSDRSAALGQVKVPTLVVHGDADPLIGPSGGRATADAVPASQLLLIPGMGHELPVQVWEQVIDAVADHARRADEAATANGH